MPAWAPFIPRKQPPPPRRTIDTGGLRQAAVLIPLFLEDGNPPGLSPRRTDTVQDHKGQISFPGGATDRDDPDAMTTALRETDEELGTPPDQVLVLGALDDVHATVSGFLITPFAGIIPHPFPFRVNAAEIAEVLSVPLSVFRDPSNLRVEQRERAGRRGDVYFYRYGAYQIWGVTAHIMKKFIDTVFWGGGAAAHRAEGMRLTGYRL